LSKIEDGSPLDRLLGFAVRVLRAATAVSYIIIPADRAFPRDRHLHQWRVSLGSARVDGSLMTQFCEWQWLRYSVTARCRPSILL
jgi:hypothetical protein